MARLARWRNKQGVNDDNAVNSGGQHGGFNFSRIRGQHGLPVVTCRRDSQSGEHNVSFRKGFRQGGPIRKRCDHGHSRTLRYVEDALWP